MSEKDASRLTVSATNDTTLTIRQYGYLLAEFHAQTGTVTFDWPRIEEVAAKNQVWGMANILLAARDAGRKGD